MADPIWTIDVSDPQRASLLLDAKSGTPASSLTLVRNDVLPRRIRLVRAEGNGAERRLVDAGIVGGSLSVAGGVSDEAPTAGTFSFQYNSNTSGLNDLPYNITAAALAIAINSNTEVAADGVTVTVQKYGNAFEITFPTAGSYDEFGGFETANLYPPTDIKYRVQSTGLGSDFRLVVIEFCRRPWFSYSGWSVAAAATGSATLVTAGSSTANAVLDVTLAEGTEGGTFRLTFARGSTFTIACLPNTRTNPEISFIAPTYTDVIGEYFDWEDDDGPVRFWFDNGVVADPPTPAGGRLVPIDVSGTPTIAQVADEIAAAANAETGIFTATIDGSTNRVYITLIDVAKVYADAQAGTSLLSITQEVSAAGDTGGGAIHRKVFTLPEPLGNVAVWYDSQSDAANIPTTAYAAARQLRVVIAANDTAAQVATATASALAASGFTGASASSALVTATCASSGDLGEATAGTSGFTITKTINGSSLAVELPWDTDASSFYSALGEQFAVTKKGVGSWRLIASELGAISAPTLVETGLVIPRYFAGQITVKDVALDLAFSEATGDLTEGRFEVKYTDAATYQSTVLNMPMTVLRDIKRYP